MLLNDLLKIFKDKKDFSGFFVGEVVINDDPLKIGRIKVQIKNLTDGIPNEDLPWTYKVYPNGTGENKKSSSLLVPGIGTKVLIVFPSNDIYTSFYFGELLFEDYDFPEVKGDYPETYGFQNKIGDKWYINMKQETMDFFHHSGTKLNIEKDGTINITGVKDINININGNSNINVKGNSDISVGGNSVINVKGNNSSKINGDLDISVGGNTTISSGGNMALKASKISLN